jgi:hypothetical protein
MAYIFKHAGHPEAYFPLFGLFSAEFALGYCHNLNAKRGETDVSSNGKARKAASTKWTT